MAPKYKLIYFDARGRAEPVRCMFAVNRVNYEDFRFKREDWPKFKQTIPTGQVPALEVDGKMLPQSGAIFRYVAKQLGFMGKNEWEATQIDAFCETVNDVFTAVMKIFFEKDEKKKDELKKEANEKTFPNFKQVLDRLIGDWGKSGYAVGDQLSLADFLLYDMSDRMERNMKDAALSSEKIKASCNRVTSNPGVAKWLKNRPETEF